MNTVIIRLLSFVVTLGIMFTMMHFKKLPFKETLALNRPNIKQVLWFALFFIIMISLEEYALNKFGLLETGQWTGYSNLHIAIRILSICLIAPITEELVFRGLLFTRVKSKFGLKAAIIIPSVLFALLHLKLADEQNQNLLVIITFTDAVFYSYARSKTNSVYVPIILHIMSNIIAIIERLI